MEAVDIFSQKLSVQVTIYVTRCFHLAPMRCMGIPIWMRRISDTYGFQVEKLIP